MPPFNTPVVVNTSESPGVVVTTPGDSVLQLQSTNNTGSVLNLEATTSNGVTESQLQFQKKFSLVALPRGPAVLVATEDGNVQLGPYAANHPDPPSRLTVSGPDDQAIEVLSTTPNGDPVGSRTRLLSVVSNTVNESQLQFQDHFGLVPLGAPNGAGPSFTYTYNEKTGAWRIDLKINPNKSAFTFDSKSLTFPDGTVQTTAFDVGFIEALQSEINELRFLIPPR